MLESRAFILHFRFSINRISGSDYGTGHGVELVGHGLSGYGSYGGGDGDGIGHGLYEGHVQHHYAPAIPVSQHVEITKPVPVPVVKNVGKLIIIPTR